MWAKGNFLIKHSNDLLDDRRNDQGKLKLHKIMKLLKTKFMHNYQNHSGRCNVT